MDTHTFPNGGWQFRQPQTGWINPYAMVSFTESVKAIIKHRKANPAVTAKHNLSTDYDAVAEELKDFTRRRLGLPAEGGAPFRQPPSRLLPASVAHAVAGVAKLAAGASILLEWQQSGEPPVNPEVSAARAAVCADCPKNVKATFSSWFTKPVADMLKSKLAKLHEMNLTTPSDDKIGICSACECPLALKAHSPLTLILKHLKPQRRAELDPRCWILSEEKSSKS